MKLRRISSTLNASVKDAARLRRKRDRYESRLFLAEGEDLLDAALARGVIPRQVFVLEGCEDLVAAGMAAAERAAGGAAIPKVEPDASRASVVLEVYACSREVMAKLSGLGSGSRVIAVFGIPEREFPTDMSGLATGAAARPLIYLAGVGDPGNVGTLIRSSAALGAAAVALGPGTADPYSSKSLRATMGAIFQIPVFLTVDAEALVAWAEASGVAVVCADAHAGQAVWKAPLEGGFALVLGSEREGIPRRLLEAATSRVRIPQERETESMNVAMAGTAIMYEALRQRSPGRQ